MNAEDRAYDLSDALTRIKQWCDAYPEDIFIPISDAKMKLAAEVLKANGIEIGAMHAGWARHLLRGIDEIASKALKNK